MKHLDNCIMKI